MLPNLFSSLGTGGPVVFVLLILSLISVGLMIVKTAQLLSVRSGVKMREAAFAQWSAGEKNAAQAMMAGGKSPAFPKTGE